MSTLSSQIANLSPEQLAKLAYELKAKKAGKRQEIPKRVPGEPCPLSFAQQRLWFVAQLDPDNPAYNCMEALRMTGKLNLPLLEQVLNEVVRRHEVLRTTFDLVADEPMQIVSSEIKLKPRVIDLEGLPASERERLVSKLSPEQRLRPFDLARGPVLRVVVLRVSEHDHAIVLTTHHIVSDAWSLGILTREISELYQAFSEGRPSPLAELPYQYADFAIWQRRWITGPVLERHLDYWQQHLADAPHVLALPADRQRPAVFTGHGAHESVLLSSELTHQLRVLGRRKGVTLFMMMLAAYEVLLSRYSGQTDFLVGTDVANRNHDLTESLIGFFVNQVVVRADLDGNPTFNELLDRVKEVTLNGYAHQDAPFEKVVDMLHPDRDLSHAPLFQVKLVIQYALTENLELPELSVGGGIEETSLSKLDLTLLVVDGDRIRVDLQYSTDIFQSSTIRRMVAQFENLLASAVSNPEQRISQIELLSSAERQQLLVDVNDTQTSYAHARCIHELFEEQAALSPEAPALTFQGQHVSYAELNSSANQLAHYLRELGIEAETPVGVCLNRSIEMVVAMLAIVKAGGAYVPLDPEYPTERLAFIVEDLSLPVILTHSAIIPRHSSIVDQVPPLCMDTESELWSSLPTTDLDSDISSDHLAYVIYTSGSTGQPKGVAVTHGAIHNLVRDTNYVTLDESDVVAQVSNSSFDAATFEIWGALLSGARLIIIEKDVALAPHALAAQLEAHGITVLFLTTALFNHMVRELPAAFRGLRHLLFGGEAVEPMWVREVLEKGPPQRLLHVYGPTETTTFATWHEVTNVDEEAKIVPIGRPLTNVQVYLLDEHLRPVPAGVQGELYIGGDGLARGYFNQPELTAERFVPHPFSTAGGERLYRTGDYVKWGSENALEFVGRVDAQVKIRGYRIEPGEVEAVLGRHTAVSECAVVMRQEYDGQKYLVAYVVAKANGFSESAYELRSYLRERLPEFMIPAAIVTLDSLPLTANGKVDRRELAARAVHVGSERAYVPPRTTTEELLCAIWQDVLRAERVGIDDNFFDLGGDSILTIQVIAKARAAGLELKVRQLFQHQTVRDLAQELECAQESCVPVIETAPFSLISQQDRMRLPAGVVDAYPLTAMQAGMLFHSELVPEAGLYHDIFSFRLRTPFDGEALQAALQQQIDLHPILRTSFNLSDFSEPLQLVHEEVAVPLRIGDLRSLSPAEQEEYLAEWLAAEKQHRFDWREAPLLRFQIERLSEESFQFSFSFHHAILDGWSVATMLTELFNAYSVLQTGDRSSKAPVSASFRDFVAAERAVVNSEEARQYWTTILSEATQSRLPRLEKTAGPSRVAGHHIDISPELSFQLKELARTAGVPLKSVLLAAHLKVLNLLVGSDDVLTGIASHGRPETADGERVLGLFLNMLPLRQQLSGGTWLDLIQKTFAAERELLPFRRYPMAQMQQDLGNDEPLFEVIFNFVHFHVYEELQNVSGLEVLGFDGVADTNFTLSADFSMELAGSQIRLDLRYDAAELSSEQIEAIKGYYERALIAMATNPYVRYDWSQLLSESELRRQLHDWNHSTAPFPHARCIHQLFAEQVVATPEGAALEFGDQQLTYAQLNDRANQLAHHLRASGVHTETIVGIMMERSPDMIVSLLGVLKAGGVYLPLDPDYPRERLAFMLEDAAVHTVLTHRTLCHRLPQNDAEVICLDEAWPEISTRSTEDPETWVSGDNLAYITYTSGSTGQPKGVQVVHRGVVRLVKENDFAHLGADEVSLQFAPLAFDASTFEIWGALLNGGRLVIMPPGPTTLAELGQALKTHHVTVLWLTAGLFNLMVDEQLDDLRGLRQLLAGGDALSVSHVERFLREVPECKLINGYGPTENTTFTCCYSMNAGVEFNHSVPIGRPIANTDVYILDHSLRPVATGARGELYTGGDGLARGYLNHPELTAERFVPHPFSSQPGARLYRTGDWARFPPNGDIEFLGRVDNQAKIRGFRIEPGEIEAVLRGHQQVREAAVVLKETDGDKQLVAYVAGDAQTGELREHLKKQLPDYMVPSFFVHLDEIPLTPNGKLDRRALPEPESIFAEEAEYEAPRTPTEELLSGLWASVLRVSRVGINDNFFELGGHSLLAIQLISRIREAFGVELPLRELFERRNVAELAQTVDDLIRAGHELIVPPLYPAIPEAVLPLSFAQQRLWFLDRLVPENIAYNVADALRLRGDLNHIALEQSINEIVRRHEAVRTTFPEVDGNPIQVITPFLRLALPLIDLSSLPDDEREAQAVRLASAEAQRPFDLQSGPLLRVTLLRLGAEDHVLLFSMHHIITDGWSNSVLAREMAALYDAFTAGNASSLPELAIQYGDYALWQRQWLSDDVLARQLDYWTSKLQGVPELSALPTDYPRPNVQLTEGAFCTHLLSAELTADLKSLAQQSNATFYMTIMAAFHALLHRYAQQTTVVTGTAVTNRPRVETESLIGFFVNTLAIRSDFDDDPTFVAYLSRLRKDALEAYAHRDLPFEMLVDQLQLARDLSYHPLFQVMFSWEEAALDQLTLTGLELGTIQVENHTSQFDLTLLVGDVNGRLRCTMQYNIALFEASTIRRMLAQFERLLASAVSNPEQHISQLELLSSAERQQLLVKLNDTHVPYPHTRCIHELFKEQVALTPEAPALTFQGQHVSYAELNSRANQLALYLRQLGVKTETPVGVCLNRSVEMMVAILAILKAGGVYIPLDPEYPTERLAFILEDVSPPVILTESTLVDRAASTTAQPLCLDTESEFWSDLPTTDLPSDLADSDSSSDQLAYVMYTSGSTGNPKGVAVPHRAVVRLVKQSAYVDFGPEEVFLQLAPVTFDAATLEIWGALLNGGRLVLMPPGAPNLAELGAVLRSEGVTVLWLTAGLFHLMVEQELDALSCVTQVVAGGDVLSAENVRRLLQAKDGSGVVVNGYGPTETTTFACCHRMNGETELVHGVPIGSPIGNTQVYVLGQAMELVGQGMLGELYIGGDGLARGYYNHPALTAERFVPHPFSSVGGERLYRTGDYVRWRDDGTRKGTLEFVGRRDTQVKIRGFRVEPGEVEAVLGQHGSIKECAVVTRAVTNGEKRLVAYVVVGNDEHGVNAFELREYLRERLPEFMLPSAIVELELLPLTPNGKVDRRELAARQVQIGGERAYVPPRTITEELLCDVWAEVLRVERVGIEDNFFEIGGDSILTIQVIAKARAMGLELTVQQIFQHQTIYELAQALELSNLSAETPQTEPFSLISEADRMRLPEGVVDAYPLTALQAGMLFHSELAPEAGLYHEIFSFHLRMPFDGETFQATLQQLIDLHPVLRTSFNLGTFSEPLQLVHHEVVVPLRIGDLRSSSQAEQEEYLAQWLEAEKRRSFDWRQAPVLRFQIERRSEESFQFSFSFHHAILDGWSVAAMLAELFAVYSSMVQGESRVSEALESASFRDFVAAEQAVLNSEEAQQYWLTMLSDRTQTRLPRLIEPGPMRMAARHVDVSAELFDGLKELARTAGVPLKSVLLAAHLRVLSLLSGSDDVITGVVSHDRTDTKDSKSVLGLFLNTLPFRRKLPGGTWLELVQETFAAERELLPFRRYPMARMQQDLGNSTPLFEVAFNFLDFDVYEELQNAGGVEVLGSNHVGDSNFPLSVDFSLGQAGLQLTLQIKYDAAELSAEQIEAVSRNYLTVLESMASTPHERYEPQCLEESTDTNRRALTSVESVVGAVTDYEAPRTTTEELLTNLWASVLRVSRVGINDNFFALGGHSLTATQLVWRVREAFGIELPLRELFTRPTVASLAETVEAALRGGVGLTAPPFLPVSRERHLPLSYAQQRLWFLDQLEPNSSFYNVPAAVRLQGILNVAALEQSLSEVVRRHEALRTTFVAVNGEPRQVIKPFTPINLSVLDVSDLNSAEREVETRRLLNEEASRPFDLARGPLVRACLVRLEAEEHVVLVTMHHIISDGWSTGVFIREVAALYKAFLTEDESPLAELPIQYADFARWQRGWLQGEVLAAQLNYWREALAEIPTMLELPTDRPRPREQTFNGTMLSFEVPAEITRQLKALSRRERVTLFMTLLAAFQTLLFRHSGQDDIVVGTPIANRWYRDLENLIGFFVNTLVLRARSLKTLTFTELLQQVREVTLASYAHQDLPFEKLVEELQPVRDLSRNPLFQVMFALQNAPLSALELPGLTLRQHELDLSGTRFDLECHLWDADEVLRGMFIYNTDLFDHATIQRMAVNFETLLRSIVANPAEAVASLRLLRAEDERQLLYGWNETSTEFPQELVHELFERQVERTPNHTAVVFEDVSVTYLELNRRSNLLATRLRSMGIGTDTVVGVMLERSVEMLVGVLGVLKAGGAYLPLDPQYPAERLQFMLTDAAVRVLLTQEHLAHNVATDVHLIRLDADDLESDAGGAQAEENPRVPVTGDNLAFIIYTSGSTGKPKGVAMTHAPLVNLTHWQMRRSANGLRTAQFASLSFDVSFHEIFSTLGNGGALVLLREETRRDANALLELLIRERIERLFMPYVALQFLAEAAERQDKFPTTLREVIHGGEQLKITRQIRRLFTELEGCTLDNNYGPSETHAVCANLLDGDPAGWPELPSIGRASANMQLYLLDEQMQPVPVGAAGEVYIGCDAMARGYLNRPETTAEKFLPNPFAIDGGSRLYRTGDRARYLADGNIQFLGRLDHQVKVRGYRVELGEIEAALMEAETVREAAVIARVASRGEMRLVAYVVSEGGVEVKVEALRQALRAKLPEYMVPSAIVMLEKLPLTPSGKVNRRALPAPERIFEAEYEVPRTPTEELLCGLWASVLRVSRVGINDNFFELGGHSLLATQLMSRVCEAFGVELPLRELFAWPTVAGLAEQVEVRLRGGMRAKASTLVPVSRDQELPLSHAQQRLWFLDQLEPGSATYNLPGALRLKGRLDVEALRHTLNEVLRRHESLRTTFPAVNGQPVQVIAQAGQLQLPVMDLSELPDEQREKEARRIAQAEAAEPFDLSTGLLVRVQLLRLAAEDHVMLFTLHHIISDGWSTGIMVREVAALYEAYLAGRESPLPELAIQYADYAVWQREWLQGEVLDQQLAYWRQHLGGELPVLQLPTDKPRPPAPNHHGRVVDLILPAQLTAELKKLSNAEGVTFYMMLLAAFKILLWRYSGQRDLVVGTPIAGRNHLATEGLIGFFVNTLVLRTEIRLEESFRALLSRVRETTLEAYMHQDVPFEKLVEELHAERRMSATPLFQVMFALQNAPMEALELPGLTLNSFDVENKISMFYLSLSAFESGEQLSLSFEYDTDLFDESTIVRMGEHFQLLLERIVDEPEKQVSDLSLLSAAEVNKLLREWNDTSAEFPHDLCIHRLFEAQVLRTPENVAVIGGDDELTYAELNRRANQLAHYLKQLGVGPEARVAILMERSLEMIVSVLAVLKAGGAYVPLDPHYPEGRTTWMLSDSQSTALLTKQGFAGNLPPLDARVICVDTEAATIAQQEEINPEFSMDVENLAYLIYTSGSTGKPKAVAVAHRSLVNHLTFVQAEFGLTPSDRMLQFASLSFDMSVEEIFPTLTTGATLVLRANEMLPTAATFLRTCGEREITVLDLPTAYWNELAVTATTQDWEAAGQLRLVVLGGEKANPDAVRQFSARVGPKVVLKNGYGPTETTILSTNATLVPREVGEPENREVPIGRPINNTTAYVLDQQLQLVPIGVVGELYLGGAGVARGYLNRPDVTAERFVPNPFSAEPGARLYQTGDLVRYRADGQLEFLGRADSQVKLRGFRIELGEIETVLREHPAVREAIVVATEDATDDKRLVAYVVMAQSGASGSELREYLRGRLPAYMVPVTFMEIAEFPLTASGKVDRRALPAPDGIGVEQEYQTPRTQTEELLSGLFASVLRAPRVGVHDNFFELGGHSLLATQLMSRVREAFAVELPLRELFVRPTVAELAEQVEAELRGGMRVRAPLVPVSREQQLPLSHAQQRLWFLDQLAPGSVAYNIPDAVRLKGRLDVEALERTLNEVVRRHEVLRTTFVAVNGEPVQVIAPARQVDMPLTDLRELPEEEREAKARQLAAAEAQRPFDLSAGPLLRVRLLRLGAEDHVVLFTVHHIVSDGWSTGILVREVGALYEAYAEGRESPLPELEIQYADYAVWQREWLQGEVLEQQLAYWRQQLEELPVLQLPTDKPRPPVQSHQGRAIGFSVPAELAAELKRLSTAEGVTLYMTLLAAFKILLWRYSGQSDVVVGTPIAGRNHLATEGLIGLFVNTLVLRTNLSGNPSLSELLDRVREVTLSAYAHQDLPFEKLVEELQPERDMSRAPLFQVMFVLQNASAERLQLPGLEASEVGGGDETAKFDLTLSLAESEGELSGSLQYSTDLFDAATIERLVQHYQLLLAGIVSHADRQLSALPLLLEEDRRKLLVEWNDTHVEYDLDQCVHELFEAQVKRTPEAAAVVSEDTQLTYAELNARANQLAHYLQAVGVGPEVPVGVLLERSPETVVTLLAIFKAGGAYVPLDPEYPDERLRFMMRDAGIEWLVTTERVARRFADTAVQSIRVDADWLEIARESHDNPLLSAGGSSLAYIIYTSGSSGTPKGAMVTHGGVVNCLQWMQQRYELTEQDAFLMHTSLNFDPSVWEVFWPLLVGGRVVVAPPRGMLESGALRYMAEQRVTCAYFVPSLLEVLKEGLAEVSSLRYVISGGEKLPLGVMRKFQQLSGAELHHSYGPTETAIAASEWTCVAAAERVLMGKAIANTQLYVLDQQLDPLPLGVTGELYIGGAGVGRGYAGRAELTAERFVPDPFSAQPGARLYRTGDLVRYGADGQLEFLGRTDSQVKLRGFRIELGEIETVLKQHANVKEAIVIAPEQRLAAYVQWREATPAGVGELRAYLKERLPEYMVPVTFVEIAEFPLTASGKVDRKALPSPEQAGTDPMLPRDVLELELTRIWEDVLGRAPIGPKDNFFDLGGHSLLAVRLIDQVERLVDQKIPLSILFQGATIEQLAGTLRQHRGQVREQSLVYIQPEGSRPPLFLVHSASGNVMSYVALARQLGREQPVYGLQSRGLDPDRKPTTRVEDMASEYLEELLAVQPDGPYFLGGWSMGGAIAFEMARQLTAQGRNVAPLVLIDSVIQTGRVKKNGLDDVSLLLELAQHHGLFLDDVDRTLNDLRPLSLDERLEFLLEKGAGYNQFPLDIGIPHLRHLFELFKVNAHALEHYRPAKLDQQVILLQAAVAPPRLAATVLRRWEKVAEVVAVERLPGDHYSMLTEPNVTKLAEQISLHLPA